MNKLRLLVALIAPFVLMQGCAQPAPDRSGTLQKVRIVVVHCEERGGNPDCITIVEFPDGTRVKRSEKWGEVGDEFMARKVRFKENEWWE